MNKKQVLRTLFALTAIALTGAGCSNQEMLPETTGNNTEETNAIVAFQLGLPGGDEVNYNRAATTQDATESTFKTLIVYDFKSASATESANSTLAGIYKIKINTTATNADTPAVGSGECVPTADGSGYSVKLSLRAKAGDFHQFVFVANDQCTAYDDVATIGTSTLGELQKSISDKEVSNGSTPNTFLGVSGNTPVDKLTGEELAKAGLAMTGRSSVMTIDSNNENNTAGPVDMIRLMARIDVKNYVPASRNFKLKSVKMTNAAPKSYLFENLTGSIWNNEKTFVTLEQNPYYKDGYKAYANGTSNEAWVASITSPEGREGTWYKKVLYAYEYPTAVSGTSTATPQLLVEYTLNGSLYTQTVNMVKTVTGKPTERFNIARNHVYTLQIGDTGTPGGEVEFTFQINNWTSHEIDADLNGGEDVVNN